MKILIAETNKPQDKFIKDALIRNCVNVEILNDDPQNSMEMKEVIIKEKPDLVLTNERKSDSPASDIICEIQQDETIKQPIFILVSGYQSVDMEYEIKTKGIKVHTIYKPYDFDELANYIKNIIKERLEEKTMSDDFYEKWKDKYYNKKYIEIEKYLTEDDFDIFNKLGIKVEKKIYTEHDFEVLNMDLLAYYDDPEEDLSEEEKQFQKSLDGTNVSREDYNKLLEKINEMNRIYNL